MARMSQEKSTKRTYPEAFGESDDEAPESLLLSCYKEKKRPGTNYIQNRFNTNQLGMMVDFMTLNPNLIRGTITLNFNKEDRKRKWEELAALLNSDDQGVKKSPSRWNKCWNDLKSTLKTRADKLKQQKATANERKPGAHLQELSELEIKVLKMIGFFKDSEDTNEGCEALNIDALSNDSNSSSLESDFHGASIHMDHKNILLHRSDPSSSEDGSAIVDADTASHLFDDLRQRSSISNPNKKIKILHHPYFKAKKEADLITQLKRQNEILDRIAESVEKIETSIQNFTESSQTLFKKSGLLENIAVNMERLAETFVIASMSLKKLSEK